MAAIGYFCKTTPAVSLTDAIIGTAIASSDENHVRYYLRDIGCAGLRLFIIPDHQPMWTFMLRNPGEKYQKVKLGTYPQISVEKAREIAWRFRKKIAKIETKGRSEKIRLIELLEKYDQFGPKRSYWSAEKTKLIYVFRPFCPRKVTDLTSGEFEEFVASYPAQGSMRRGLSLLRTVLRWGKENGFY